MKEIKFRAWDKEQKVFLDVEAHFSNVISITPDEWSRGNFSHARFLADQTRFALLQYTGLKDKNDVEIYEGDIVKFTGEMWQPQGPLKDFFREVKWNSKLARFDWVSDPQDLEVIGNIYEHPELANEQ